MHVHVHAHLLVEQHLPAVAEEYAVDAELADALAAVEHPVAHERHLRVCVCVCTCTCMCMQRYLRACACTYTCMCMSLRRVERGRVHMGVYAQARLVRRRQDALHQDEGGALGRTHPLERLARMHMHVHTQTHTQTHTREHTCACAECVCMWKEALGAG